MHEIKHVGRREDIIPKIKFPFKLFVEVEWPETYVYDGVSYTRAVGDDAKVNNYDFTGGPCRLYTLIVKDQPIHRIWVKADGDWICD